jgi:hypothetical protein
MKASRLSSVTMTTIPNRLFACALILLVDGCAANQPAPRPEVAAAMPDGAQSGRVVALRRVATDAQLQAGLLAALGSTGGTAGDRAEEVIVRVDSGQTLSVVTPVSLSVAQGARVLILQGGGLRLQPLPNG